jgi:rhamnopyranosyl-N-acetylglucosaminyl-diphospho-decaprenol beta-1,3/1,4-galactofuranosyltransferase
MPMHTDPTIAGVGMEDTGKRIMAVVLTHNAPAALERCRRAIAGQTVPPDALLVVDNASDPPVPLGDPTGAGLPTTVLRSEVNTGPAGGYARALAEFLASGFRHAWVLDDDMVPDPSCLERLWAVAARKPDSAFVFPISRQPDGTYGLWPSWCGFIVARQIIDSVGLPMAELFWWAEDTEYLQWRIPSAGFEMQVVSDALVDHDPVRHGDGVPLWKYYYESRNMLYVHLRVKHRLGRYPLNMSKLLARAILREKGGRLRRLAVMARGLSDGARGKLGLCYPVEPMRERSRST